MSTSPTVNRSIRGTERDPLWSRSTKQFRPELEDEYEKPKYVRIALPGSQDRNIGVAGFHPVRTKNQTRLEPASRRIYTQGGSERKELPEQKRAEEQARAREQKHRSMKVEIVDLRASRVPGEEVVGREFELQISFVDVD